MLKTYSMDCHNSTIIRGCRPRILFLPQFSYFQIGPQYSRITSVVPSVCDMELQYLARYFRIVTLKIDFNVACGMHNYKVDFTINVALVLEREISCVSAGTLIQTYIYIQTLYKHNENFKANKL